MKKWLYAHFLPLWAKETVLQENKALAAENAQLKGRVRELESYIRGLHKGLGRRPRGEKKEIM